MPTTVKEQGATRRARALPDFDQPGRVDRDHRRPPRNNPKRRKPSHKERPSKPLRDKSKPKRVPGFGKPDRAPVPSPQNPSKPLPFARAGRKVGRLLGRATLPLRFFDLAGLLDDFAPPLTHGSGDMVPNPANGWRQRSRCSSVPAGGKTIWQTTGWPGWTRSKWDAWMAEGAPIEEFCLAGQAGTENTDWFWYHETVGEWWNHTSEPNDSPAARFAHKRTYWRLSDSFLVEPQLVADVKATFGPAILPQPNPNVMRYLPSIAPAADPPIPAELVIGIGEGLGHPSGREAAEAALEQAGGKVSPVPHRNVAIIVPGGQGTGEGETAPPRPPRPTPPPPPHQRRKPYGRVRETKKAKGSVYFFFAVADALSEAAEVVDAAFEALPEDVKARWSRGRTKRRFIDNAGQYGIDGADWKVQAVWHNAHKIEAVDFLRNLMANQIEDELIGSLHRNLPRNFINADEEGQLAYSKLVKELLQAMGLEEEDDNGNERK